MTRSTNLLKAALAVACFTPPLLNLAPGAGSARGQSGDPIWAIGSQVLSFPQSGSGVIQAAGLPTSSDPNIPDFYEYQGASPIYSQNVQYDPDGNVLFFIIDGRIFNREGLLIGDNALDPSCETCLWPGTNRVEIIPVPGSCTLYYIVSTDGERTDRENEDTLKLHVGVLDVTEPSDIAVYNNNPDILGRLVNVNDQAYFDLLDAAILAYGMDPVQSASPEDHLWIYELPGSLGAPTDAVRLDVIQAGPNESRLLVINGGRMMGFLLFSGDGLHFVTSFDKTLVPGYTYESNQSRRGEVEMHLDGNTLKVAHSHFYGDEDVTPFSRRLGVALWEFSTANLGSYALPLSGPPLLYEVDDYDGSGPLDFDGNLIEHPRVCGLEFSPSGQYCYFIKSSYSPAYNYNFGYINTTLLPGVPGAVNELYIGSTADSRKLADSELELNVAPNGTGYALYAIQASVGPVYDLVALTDPDNPDPVNWNASALTLPNIALRTGMGDVQYRVLNGRVKASTHLTFLQEDSTSCCEDFALLYDESRVIPAGTDSWTLGNNPFGNTNAAVYIENELRLQTGAVITMNNMEFRFGPNGSLVIEAGARLVANNSVLTSSCNRRWLGVRVNGTTGNTLQLSSAQGVFYLFSSKVENAITGVWTATIGANNTPIGTGFGGRVHANNSLFLNNITGVKIESYHRFTSGGTPLANLSYFNNCDFVSDGQWPDMGINYPKFHAHLQQVDKIRFTNCSFRNDAHLNWIPSQWGIGIFAPWATVNCTGNSDYANNRFLSLNAGAMMLFNLSGAFINKIDGMGFANNMVGLYDWSDSDAWITRNQFVTNQTTNIPGNISAGMFVFASEGYTVERNSFITLPNAPNVGCGVWFRGPAYFANRIYDNLFDGTFASCVVEGEHGSGDAWSSSGTQGTYTGIGLELLCNDHYNTVYDHFLLEGYTPNNLTSIRNQQGYPGFAGTAANNRFFTPRTCIGNGSLTWDILTLPPLLPPPQHFLDIEYVYLNNGDPVLRPRCIHEAVSPFTAESDVDLYYDLRAGFNLSGPFDKESHCFLGDLDATSTTSSSLNAALVAKHAELASAIAVYNGTVDGGDAPDLSEAINQNNPWYTSHSLRDLLLAQSPLSDDVLKQVIQREQPMDPWHLTQVLIANSELSSSIWGELEEANVLAPFFINILRQYDQNVSLRQLLEQEIALRNNEKARIQHQLVSLWAEDSVTTGRLDSLDAIYALDTLGLSVVPQYWLAIERGDLGLADALGSVLGQYPEMTDMVNFGNVVAGLDGDVRNASPSELTAFQELAFDTERAHNALGWAALWAAGQTDSLPPMVIPAELRSAMPFRPDEILENEPVIGAFPNPTSDRVMITLPEGLEASILEVVDPLGRTVDHITVEAGTRGVQLDLDQYPNGLYIARLSMAGLNVGEVKFSLVR